MIITFKNGIPYDESCNRINPNKNDAHTVMTCVFKYFDKKFNGKISAGSVDSCYYRFSVRDYSGEYKPIHDRTMCIENNEVILDKLTLRRCWYETD